MRKKIIAGNWKMHGNRAEVRTLITELKQGVTAFPKIEMIVFPSFVFLSEVQALLQNSAIFLGAQNIYPAKSGAFTGEISTEMLVETGCKYVLVGHSERRSILREPLDFIAKKFKAVLQAGMCPVLCVGETQEEREKNMTEKVIDHQLQTVMDFCGLDAFREVIIAYEPVWAIGTGLTATPEQAQQVHQFIRTLFAKQDVELAQNLSLLYGGSVKADNAASLFAMPDVDGALVGGASLIAKDFLAIAKAAEQVSSVLC